MSFAPAVIVYDRGNVDAVLAAGRPVTLLSPPGFAVFAGGPWWRALLDQAGFTGFSLLDCGDAAGRAVEALRLGLPGIVLAGDVPNFAAVAAIAASCGAMLLDTAPAALDLGERGAARHLGAWLGRDGESG